MDNNLQEKILEINPYVRHVFFVDGLSIYYHVPWRMLYDYEAIFVLDGELHILEPNNEYVLYANDFHIMPPHIKHKRYIPDGKFCQYYNAHFDMFYEEDNDFSVQDVYIRPCELKIEEVNVIEELLKSRKNDVEVPRKVNIPDAVRVTQLFEQLKRVYQEKALCWQLETKGLMLCILREFFTHLNATLVDNEFLESAISRFVVFTGEHSGSDISGLTADFGFSKEYFRKIFKRKLNISPKKYVINARIESAKRLLGTTRKNVREIAAEMGYDNPYYFSRLFKKYVGLSPKHYRDSLKADKDGKNGGSEEGGGDSENGED